VAVPAIVLALGAGTASAAACDGADARALTPSEGRAAVRCLLNAERARQGLGALRSNVRLRYAATLHARDMARRTYFNHVSPDGRTAEDRIRGAGYLRRVHAWSIGEALAYGTESAATPRALVDDLLSSPGHREIVLDPEFDDIGIGFATRPPVRTDRDGATLVVDVGTVQR
jgi:uncharacterized protein YkwD